MDRGDAGVPPGPSPNDLLRDAIVDCELTIAAMQLRLDVLELGYGVILAMDEDADIRAAKDVALRVLEGRAVADARDDTTEGG